jgi:DnaK suppressor protein
MANVMKPQDLSSFRSMLMELRARLRGEVAQVTEEGDETSNLAQIGLDSADPGTGTYDLEFTLGLIENERETLADIQAALNRIDQGSYGVCEDCGGPIAKSRLQVLPYTRVCIDCARERERQAGIAS